MAAAQTQGIKAFNHNSSTSGKKLPVKLQSQGQPPSHLPSFNKAQCPLPIQSCTEVHDWKGWGWVSSSLIFLSRVNFLCGLFPHPLHELRANLEMTQWGAQQVFTYEQTNKQNQGTKTKSTKKSIFWMNQHTFQPCQQSAPTSTGATVQIL